MKKYNILLLGFFIIATQSMTTTHAMGRAGGVRSMGALRIATPVQAMGRQVMQPQIARKFVAHNAFQNAEHVVYQKDMGSIRSGLDTLRAMDKRRVLLLTGAAGLSAGAFGMHELAKYKLESVASLDSVRSSICVASYRSWSLFMSDKQCFNILNDNKTGGWFLNQILENKSTQDRACRMVANNLDFVFTDSVWNGSRGFYNCPWPIIFYTLLKNESTREKTAAMVLNNSIYLMGVVDGENVLRILLNYPNYKDAARLILDRK